MASALTDFVKKREFLVCMDSDGCVMDTVRIKHCNVFCPELIRVFSLDEYADMITVAWKEINITGITRGIPRFESVVQIFDRLRNRGIEVPGSEDIAAWVRTASELSTASLQQEMLRTGSLALRNCRSGTTPATAGFRPWNPPLSLSPGWRPACVSCTLWPMWRWCRRPMSPPSRANGPGTACPATRT